MSIEAKQYRLVTRSDFDGVVCAVLLKELNMINEIKFAHPKDMQDELFSEKFACPVCNIAISEIEPRIFSFNTPHGACPVCNGLGTVLSVDAELVLNPDLTINEGGIFPKGVPIGRILDWRPAEFGLYTEARVKLNASLSGLEEMWVMLP